MAQCRAAHCRAAGGGQPACLTVCPDHLLVAPATYCNCLPVCCSTLNYTYDEWVAEIQGQRDWTVDECGIPEE